MTERIFFHPERDKLQLLASHALLWSVEKGLFDQERDLELDYEIYPFCEFHTYSNNALGAKLLISR